MEDTDNVQEPSELSTYKLDHGLSLRQRRKQATKQQIASAAKAVIGELGFQKATVRDIAREARVGLGTVMLYARDKHDLVLLMYNDEIQKALERGARRFRRGSSTIENLVRFLASFYEGYHGNIKLARAYLQVPYFEQGLNTDRLIHHRARKQILISKILEHGQRSGEIRQDRSPADMARQVLLLHRMTVRDWIGKPEPELRDGLESLKAAMQMLIEGLGGRK